MVSRDGKMVRHVSPKTAAWQTDFYTVELDDGSESLEVEKFLGRIEAAAASAVRLIDAGAFPLSQEDREHLALFMSFQMTRGESSRDKLQQMYDHLTKMIMRTAPRDYVRSFMESRGAAPSEEELDAQIGRLRSASRAVRVEPHKNEQLGIMLETAPALVPYFLDLHWQVFKFSNPSLLTGDHPVALSKRRDPQRPWEGVGVGTADEIYFPLDPRTALVMFRSPCEEKIRLSHPNWAANKINQTVAFQSYHWIFHHPGHDPLKEFKLAPRPPMVVSGLGAGDLSKKGRV